MAVDLVQNFAARARAHAEQAQRPLSTAEQESVIRFAQRVAERAQASPLERQGFLNDIEVNELLEASRELSERAYYGAMRTLFDMTRAQENGTPTLLATDDHPLIATVTGQRRVAEWAPPRSIR